MCKADIPVFRLICLTLTFVLANLSIKELWPNFAAMWIGVNPICKWKCNLKVFLSQIWLIFSLIMRVKFFKTLHPNTTFLNPSVFNCLCIEPWYEIERKYHWKFILAVKQDFLVPKRFKNKQKIIRCKKFTCNFWNTSPLKCYILFEWPLTQGTIKNFWGPETRLWSLN